MNKKLVKLLQVGIPVLVVLIIVIFFLVWYTQFYSKDQEGYAINESYVAQKSFAQQDWEEVIEGKGTFPGFKQIIKKYPRTKTANLGHYYLGIAYLNTGAYEAALKSLKNYKPYEPFTDLAVQGLIGDCYVQMKNYDAAQSYYKAAVSKASSTDGILGSLYMLKLGLLYEALHKNQKALGVYNDIKRLYKDLPSLDIDKYISRAQVKLQLEQSI